MKIETSSVFAEFVHELGDDYIIDAVNEHGVSFYHVNNHTIKFNIALSPMYGIHEGNVGFVIVKNCVPYILNEYSFANPNIFDDIKAWVIDWVNKDSLWFEYDI